MYGAHKVPHIIFGIVNFNKPQTCLFTTLEAAAFIVLPNVDLFSHREHVFQKSLITVIHYWPEFIFVHLPPASSFRIRPDKIKNTLIKPNA